MFLLPKAQGTKPVSIGKAGKDLARSRPCRPFVITKPVNCVASFTDIMNEDDDEQERRREEERQRRLERKRAYNRELSKKTRQRTKDQIAELTAKVEYHSSRANDFEKQNTELRVQVQALTAANQSLTLRLAQALASGGGGVKIVS